MKNKYSHAAVAQANLDIKIHRLLVTWAKHLKGGLLLDSAEL